MTDELFQILTEPKKIKSEIKRVCERIEDTRLMMLPSAIRYDKDKVLSSPSDPMIKFAEKLDELEKQKENLIQKYIISRQRMTDLIEMLTEDNQKDIIQARYMKNLRFYQIADEIGYSEAQTYRIYADAIEQLERIINDNK